MRQAPTQIRDLVERATGALGYELVGVEWVSHSKGRHLLRVYIDAEHGVDLTDCERVSHQVSGLLDVEDPLAGDYALEVSSPGLDRPLFELAHFARFVGQTARVRLYAALDGRSNFKGAITAVEGDEVVLEVDGEPVRLPFGKIASARLVPTF